LWATEEEDPLISFFEALLFRFIPKKAFASSIAGIANILRLPAGEI
jgi:hypothetical protein